MRTGATRYVTRYGTVMNSIGQVWGQGMVQVCGVLDRYDQVWDSYVKYCTRYVTDMTWYEMGMSCIGQV